MVTAPNPTSTHFRSTLILAACLGVVVLAIYLWAIFTAQFGLLNTLGIACFGLLLLCPVLVAFQTVRLTLQMEAGAPLHDYFQASLQRARRLLFVDALIAVPICVFFSLYLQIALAGIFSQFATCQDGICPQTLAVDLPTFIPQAILVLFVAIGLWGLNLLAVVVGASLTNRWRRMTPALSGTILALVVTVALIYTLLSVNGLPQIPVDLAVALLPYLLTGVAWRFLASPSAPSTPSS